MSEANTSEANTSKANTSEVEENRPTSEQIQFIKKEINILLSFTDSNNEEMKQKWNEIMSDEVVKEKGETFVKLAQEYPPWRKIKSGDSYVLVGGMHIKEDGTELVCCHFINETGITFKLVKLEDLEKFKESNDEEEWKILFSKITETRPTEIVEVN